jgi:hypothetical protein
MRKSLRRGRQIRPYDSTLYRSDARANCALVNEFGKIHNPYRQRSGAQTMFKPLSIALGASFLAIAAPQAGNASLIYTMTCISDPNTCNKISNATMTFTLPEFPIPSSFPANEFQINNIQAFWNGSGDPTFATLSFVQNNVVTGGLFVRFGNDSIGGAGPQIWQGNRASPELLAGQFTMTGTSIVSEYGFASRMSWQVDVEQDSSPPGPMPVPEPTSLLIILASLGLLGTAKTFHRRTAAANGSHSALLKA